MDGLGSEKVTGEERSLRGERLEALEEDGGEVSGVR
jgi:hypothetical protein